MLLLLLFSVCRYERWKRETTNERTEPQTNALRKKGNRSIYIFGQNIFKFLGTPIPIPFISIFLFRAKYCKHWEIFAYPTTTHALIVCTWGQQEGRLSLLFTGISATTSNPESERTNDSLLLLCLLSLLRCCVLGRIFIHGSCIQRTDGLTFLSIVAAAQQQWYDICMR